MKLAVTGVLLAAGLTGCDRITQLRGLSTEDARAIGKEAYIAGYPAVTYYTAMHAQNIDTNSGSYKGPINTILSESVLPKPGEAGASRPNGDVLISTLQADLRAEPLVLCVPAIPNDRYYSMQFTDMNMFNFGSTDNRKNSGSTGCVLLIGPQFLGLVPTGVKQVLRSSSSFARVIYRTQVYGPEDLDVAAQLQAGFTIQPLSVYRRASAANVLPVTPINWPAVGATASDADFPELYNFLLPLAPLFDKAQEKRFGRIGIGPDRSKPFSALSAETRDAVLAGIAEGKAAIAARAKAHETRVNGWRVDSGAGDRASFGGDGLLRAAVVSVAPFAPSPADAIFLPTDRDGRGAPLDASAAHYSITFPAGLTPQVDAFWSLSVYDARTGGLVANPLERYRANSLTAQNMVSGADGSITIYLGPTSPGPLYEPNWLPTPAGPFSLVLRMYMPKATPPSILPAGNGSWAPPAVAVADPPRLASSPALPVVVGEPALQ